MIQAAPAASFEATAQFDTGLTGVLGVRVTDNAGATTTARVTAGIAEYPVGSGLYQATLTAPATAGQYSVVWDDGTNWASDDLLVSGATLTAASGPIYASSAELKAALNLTGQTYADADITRACAAASRAIDNKTNRFFYTDTTDRYYTPNQCDWALDIVDVQAVATLTVDTLGNETFSSTWTQGVDFDLEPFNNAVIGRPYERIRIRYQSGRTWPPYIRSVKVAGTFGWASVPSDVNQYALILASKLLKRSREAPFGVLAYGLDEQIAVRIARNDPDFELLLGDYVKSSPGA